jgi:integrase
MRADAKGPRLYLRPDCKQWVIRDGNRQIRLGLGQAERGEAETRLAEYIADKYEPAREKGRRLAAIPVADVIALYLDDHGPSVARPAELATRARYLLDWWGERTLADVDGRACRAYAAHRGSASAARRELEDLRAAIRYHWRQGYAAQETKVVLPDKPAARTRWLTRREAAALLWCAYRRTPHVAKFILVALYTGSRSGAVCRSSFRRGDPGAGWVDTSAGVFWRRAPDARVTRKRQPPAPLSGRLLAHLRRWERGAGRDRRNDGSHFVVSYRGRPVSRVTKAFRQAATAAGLDPSEVTPHTLRHTAATWMMQAGADPWAAAGLLGMSVEVLTSTYGHWHHDFGRDAAERMARAGGRTTSAQANPDERT